MPRLRRDAEARHARRSERGSILPWPNVGGRTDQVNVLFTSVGRRVELIRAFRRAYDALGLRGRTVGVDIDPLAPAFRVVDRALLAPPSRSPDYVTWLVQVCTEERIDLILPLIDGDIPILAEHHEALESGGAQVLVPPLDAVMRTRDKWRTLQLFKQLDLAVPATWLPEQLSGVELSYPLIVKPRSGSAGKHAFRVDGQRELAFFVEYVPDAMIQEFIVGPEITTDVLCDHDGVVLGAVSRRRIEVRSGEVAKGVTIRDDTILDGCVRLATTLGAVGPITVQCIVRDGTPYYTEINSRFGGGVPLGIAAGFDAPRLLLGRRAGIPVDVPELGAYAVGLYMTRFDEAFFLTESDCGRLESGPLRS